MPRPRIIPTPERRVTAGNIRNRCESIPFKAYKTKTGAFGRIMRGIGFEQIKPSAHPTNAEKNLFQEAADVVKIRETEVKAVFVPKKNLRRDSKSFFCVVKVDAGRLGARYFRVALPGFAEKIFNQTTEFRAERDRRSRL